MTDLTTRLEHLDSFISGDGCKSWGELIALGVEAAEEIRRLRGTIEQLRLVAGSISIDRPFSEIKQEIKHG